MDSQIADRLLQINQEFYSAFAHAFSDSRSEREAKLNSIISLIRDGVKVLDAGCGNGRVALALERAGRRVDYRGVDASRELIAIAREQCGRLKHVRADFFVADLTRPGWHSALGDERFAVALALAVLHHIPSFDLRARVLGDLAARVRAGGTLILTHWQFRQHARMRRKIIPWGLVGIAEKELEEGDTLLHWKRGGTGYRYCHQVTPEEIERIASLCGLRIDRQFSDEDGLNLYSILRK